VGRSDACTLRLGFELYGRGHLRLLGLCVRISTKFSIRCIPLTNSHSEVRQDWRRCALGLQGCRVDFLPKGAVVLRPSVEAAHFTGLEAHHMGGGPKRHPRG
jgi:hypothetical protein